MEKNKLLIEKVTKQSLSGGTRIFRIVYGIIMSLLGVLLIAKNSFSVYENMSILGLGLIIMGIGSVLYGFIGKLIIKQEIKVYSDGETIKITRTFELKQYQTKCILY
ncbi:MAG: hypothetical protein MZV63_41550 [Marinilabiliales bacterium]|nr:hypothetical protein [Marinilabiliales bacterium]